MSDLSSAQKTSVNASVVHVCLKTPINDCSAACSVAADAVVTELDIIPNVIMVGIAPAEHLHYLKAHAAITLAASCMAGGRAAKLVADSWGSVMIQAVAAARMGLWAALGCTPNDCGLVIDDAVVYDKDRDRVILNGKVCSSWGVMTSRVGAIPIVCDRDLHAVARLSPCLAAWSAERYTSQKAPVTLKRVRNSALTFLAEHGSLKLNKFLSEPGTLQTLANAALAGLPHAVVEDLAIAPRFRIVAAYRAMVAVHPVPSPASMPTWDDLNDADSMPAHDPNRPTPESE